MQQGNSLQNPRQISEIFVNSAALLNSRVPLNWQTTTLIMGWINGKYAK